MKHSRIFLPVAILALNGTAMSAMADSPSARVPNIQLPDDDTSVAPAPIVSVGGYGEMHFNAVFPENGASENEVDFHRFVMYIARDLSDDIRFYSEIEIEHSIAGDDKVGEVAVEQAYVEYHLGDDTPIGSFGVRTGIVLVPMGLTNLWHEPATFHGVERPQVDTVIVPSTWREGGLGIYGSPTDSLSYQFYVLGGLNPLKFSKKSGIRGGRQKVGEARADGLALAARLQYEPSAKLSVGVSGYANQAGKNSDEIDKDVLVLGGSADLRAHFSGVEIRAQVAGFAISDTEALAMVVDADGNTVASVGDKVFGTFAEVAYNLFQSTDRESQLLPFTRVEYYNTDPDDDTRAVTDIVIGLTFRPIPQLAFKQDLTIRRKGGNAAGDNSAILNLGFGFLY